MGGSKMIKLKKLLKEASLSPSYNKMYREWTVLHDVLGPVSDESKKLIHLPLFKKWWDALHRGKPEAIKLFPKLLTVVEKMMHRRNARMEKEVKSHIKRNGVALKKFASMGSKLKI